MPPPFAVKLVPHDPRWSAMVAGEAGALAKVIGPVLVTVHHIGSTAIPNILAKPILDLMPVLSDLAALDSRQSELETLGYEYWGEFGIAGRRYCTKSDMETGKRLVQLHCFQVGSEDIRRHLAFRDYLIIHPSVAAEYEQVKVACAKTNAHDSHEYGACKSDWIKAVERDALRPASIFPS
jgi:GrpB-like predicted nucleotidyltransferase (UPF0157 family)